MAETAASYGELLRRPGAARGFAAGLFARLANTMFPLALILCTQQVTGSFAFAGLALSVFSVATLLGPVKARLADRHGQRAVLVPLALATAAAETALALAAVADVRSELVYVLLAVVSGALTPPLGPAARAFWAALTPQPQDRVRAYNLDTVAEETLYTAGPLIVALTLTLGGRSVPILVGAVCLPMGTIGLVLALKSAAQAVPTAVDDSAEPEGPARQDGPDRRPLLWLFRHRGYAVMVGVVLGFGLGLGPIDIATAARATDDGHPGSAGVLLAVLSVGSVAGGLLWDRMRTPHSRSGQLLVLLGVLVLTSAAAAMTRNLLLFGAALLLLGTAVSPMLVVAYVGADELVPVEGQMEASSWLNTANNMGVAGGAAGAGFLVDHGGPGHAILGGTAVLVVTLLTTFLTRSILDSGAGSPHDARTQGLTPNAAD